MTNLPLQKVLLLNASNKEDFPVYPYAFIQVPAIARQAGIDVVCKDLLGIPQDSWKQTIQILIELHSPVMILITLRNTDSFDSPEYERDDLKERNQNAFFPIERTKELIAAIREISDLMIGVGGIGFSLLVDELMRFLRPDFGVYEGPDDFFAHFEDVKNGKLDKVANLLFFQDGELISNPRTLYPPLADTEYTPQTIEAMMEFYAAFPSPGFLGAAVEIMRGCNHTCVFCGEPHSKGAQVRYRDLSIVMEEIEILVSHGVSQLYFVSSELNPEGNEFVLELADRIWSFNESQAEGRKITWYGANYLLKFETDEYKRLCRSGFTGGWFDITALDDENARSMRTPYRNACLLRYLKIHAEHQIKQLALRQAQKALGTSKGEDAINQNDKGIEWTMFLGNPATTVKTIRNTLQIANREEISQLFGGCYVHANIRVFDYEMLDESTLAVTYSIRPDLVRTGYQQILPSFAYPPALLHHFGSEEEIGRMFAHVADTYLSTKYQKTRNWLSFLKQNTTAGFITSWMEEILNTKSIYISDHIKLAVAGEVSPALQQLFSKASPEEEIFTFQNLAIQVVESLLSTCLEAFPDSFDKLGFPTSVDQLEHMTPYELAVPVFNKWRTEDELINEIAVQAKPFLSDAMQGLVQFCIQAMLYRLNVQVNPKYRDLFVLVRTV